MLYLSQILYCIGLSLVSLTNFRILGGYLNVSDAFFIAASVFVFVYCMVADVRKVSLFISDNMFLFPVVLFILGAVLSLVQTDDYLESAIVASKVLFIFLLWIPTGAILYDNFRCIKMFEAGLFVGFGLPILFLLLDKFVMPGIVLRVMSMFNCADAYYASPWDSRCGSIMGHPNNFATLLICAIPYYYLLYKRSRSFGKILNVVVLLVGMYALLKTGSRSALISVFASFGILYILLGKKNLILISTLKYVFMMVILLSVLVFASHYIPDSPISRLMEMNTHSFGTYLPDKGRVSSANDALSYFLENPLTGVGVNYASSMNEKLFVHNTILKFAAAMGIFGLASILFFYFLPIIKSIQLLRHKIDDVNTSLLKYSLATTIGWILFDMFQPQFHQRVKWVTALIVVLYFNHYKSKADVDES